MSALTEVVYADNEYEQICREVFEQACGLAMRSTTIFHLREFNGAAASARRLGNGETIVLYQPDDDTMMVGFRTRDAYDVEWVLKETKGELAVMPGFNGFEDAATTVWMRQPKP